MEELETVVLPVSPPGAFEDARDKNNNNDAVRGQHPRLPQAPSDKQPKEGGKWEGEGSHLCPDDPLALLERLEPVLGAFDELHDLRFDVARELALGTGDFGFRDNFKGLGGGFGLCG